MIRCENAKDVSLAISGKYKADFKVLTELKERPYVMHRTIGNRNVYALYNFPAGSKCLFNSSGEAQLWNPWTGEIASLSEYAVQKKKGLK